METLASPPAKSNHVLPPAVLVSIFADAISRRSGRRVVRVDPFLTRLAEVCADDAEFRAASAELLRRVGLPTGKAGAA